MRHHQRLIHFGEMLKLPICPTRDRPSSSSKLAPLRILKNIFTKSTQDAAPRLRCFQAVLNVHRALDTELVKFAIVPCLPTMELHVHIDALVLTIRSLPPQTSQCVLNWMIAIFRSSKIGSGAVSARKCDQKNFKTKIVRNGTKTIMPLSFNI